MAPKKKQEKMALGDFLTNQSLGSWADEMDSVPLPSASSGYSGGGNRDRDRDRDAGPERRSFTQPAWEQARSSSNMGGRGASYDRPRFPEREQLPLPTRPPYTAHLGNLAYDVSQTDIEGFLDGCEVTNVRIVEDKLDRKPKGFGYVEFGTLDGLKKALTLTETNFMGRNIKISVAEPPKERAESSRDLSDWSRKGPLPELPQNSRQPSRGKSGFFAEENKSRDLGNWERRGPLSPVPNSGPPLRESGRVREGGGPPRERRPSPSWGEGRSDAGSRPPREGRLPVERVPTAAEQDNQWRARMRPDPSLVASPDASTPTSPAQQAPKERPRLNLTKRTVSTAEPDAQSTAGSDSQASPFGAARPIDTAQREREVEEKRELVLRQKKEAEEKAKEEKGAKDAASRAERDDRTDRGQADEEKVVSPTGGSQRGTRRLPRPQVGNARQGGGPKENGEATQQARPSFSVLGHDEDDAANAEAAEGAGDAVDAPANGNIPGDKDTKPRDVRVTKGAADTPTAEAMDDDGWSTVATKSKNKGRGGSRAMAS